MERFGLHGRDVSDILGWGFLNICRKIQALLKSDITVKHFTWK